MAYFDNNLISEVEKNQKLMLVGDSITYIDNCNFQRWNVTELFDGGFIAIDSDGYEDIFYFNSLQLGWTFSEKTKRENSLNYRFKYVN